MELGRKACWPKDGDPVPLECVNVILSKIGIFWVGVIMGEFLVAKSGLGFLIVYGGQVAQLDTVMMSIVILSIIAFLMYEIVSIFQKKLVGDRE